MFTSQVLEAATSLHLEDQFVFSHSSGVLGYSWDGKKVARKVSKPAASKIDGDAAVLHYLTGNTISRSQPDGSRRTLWTAPGTVTDLFLAGNELWVLRPNAPITRLDRFDGTVLGEIALDFDAAAFKWSRHASSRQVMGVRRTAGGFEVALIAATDAAPTVRRFETTTLRTEPGTAALQPCRGDITAWFPDGTLRKLADGEVLHDTGAPILAACSITADVHAIASGSTVKIIDTNGLVLTELKTKGPIAALGYRDRKLWMVTTAGAAQIALLADAPTGVRPTLFPPAGGTHYPLGFQMLPDGNVLMGDDKLPTAHLYSTERGDFTSGFPLPKPGAVQAFPELSRIGFASTSQGPRTPWFANFTRYPAFTPVSDTSMQDASVRSRTATDRSWVFTFRNSGTDTALVYDVATGATITPNPYRLTFDPEGAWHDSEEVLLGIQGGRTVQRHEYDEAGILKWVGEDFQGFVTDYQPDWIRLDQEGQAMATNTSLWLRNPSRHVVTFDRPVNDAAWVDQVLYTVRQSSNYQTVVEERRGPFYLPGRTRTLSGSPAALRSHDGKLVVGVRSPRMEVSFVTLDTALQPVTSAIQAAAVPAAVTVAKRDIDSITLGWDALPSGTASAVRVEYRAVAKKPKPWTISSAVPATATSARIDGIPAGKPYEFRLTIANGDDIESTNPLQAISRSAKELIDGSPYDLTTRLNQGGGVEVIWSDRTSDETGYQLKRYDPSATQPVVIDLPANTTYYADLAAESGKTYRYSITPRKGESAGIESPQSEIKVQKLDSGYSTSSLRAEILSLGIASWRWENPAISDVRYRILQRRLNFGPWQRVAALDPGTNTYLDMKAPQGGRYEYRLVDGTAEGEVGPLSTVRIDHPSFNGGGRDGGARWNDIYYLLIPHDGRIRRFDLKTETWLPDLLPRVPEAITHLHVSDLGIFFSSSSQIYRIPLEGGETESVYNYGAWSFWTSGVRLHIATSNNTIVSIALSGPDVGKPEIRSLVAAEPWSIHLSPDRTRVYGCSKDGSFITLLEEIEPGKFVTQRYRGTALPGSPSRAWLFSAADQVIDTNGNTYRSYDLLPTGRPRLGVSHVEETESGFALLLQGGSLYCYDESFDSQGFINPSFGGVTFAHHADDVWFFRFDATAPGCWIEHHEDAAPLGIPVFDPNDPDPFFGEPKAHVVDALGRHWSIHSQQRQLVLRTPGQVGTGARLDIGGTFIAEAFDPSTQLLAIMIRNARGEPEMRIFNLSNPALAPIAFMLPAGSHSLAWVNGKLIVNGSETGAVYLADGSNESALPATAERSRTLDVPAAGLTATLSPSGEYMNLTVRKGATQFTESFTGGTILAEAVLAASPGQDRLFTWPGGLRLLSAPATTIPMNCFQPIAAAWAGDRLLIIDRQAKGAAWLVSYNSQTGREIDRRPVKDSRLLSTVPGGVVDLASLNDSRRLQFTRFTPELDIASHGSGRVPSLLPNASVFTWVSGAKARLQTRVDGDGPVTYEWLKNEVTLPGKTSRSLEFAAATEADSGNYRLRVTSAHGTALSQELRLTVLPPYDLGSRKGNLLEFTSTEFREHRQNGERATTISLPEVIYSTSDTAFNLDDAGRIHLVAFSDIRKRYCLYTFDPARGWSTIELPQPAAPYNAYAESRGNVLRFHDFAYDFGEGYFTRTNSNLQRAWGDRFQSSAGLEDIRGNLVSAEKPDPQLLPNGWKVGGSWVANGFFHILNTLDGRSRMFRPSPDGVAASTGYRNQLEQVQENELIMGTTKFNFDTLELTRMPITLQVSSRLRVVGGNRGLTVKKSTFITSQVEQYYAGLSFFYQFFIPGLAEKIPFGGSTPWITPHTRVGNGQLTAWEMSFLPFGAATWKGLPVSWTYPIKEGNSIVHAFNIMIDPVTGKPFSRVEFSNDLQTWTTDAPAGATLNMGAENVPHSIRLTPSESTKPIFFRFATPPNPFPQAE